MMMAIMTTIFNIGEIIPFFPSDVLSSE
jgi:hypothetical protein